MSHTAGTTDLPRHEALFDPAINPALYDGVLSKRVVAFLVDAAIIIALLAATAFVIFILGIVTFGLAWLLFFAPLFALVALGYVALTLGGPASATPGMRFAGIEMRTTSGRTMYPLLAALHALLFWLSFTMLTPFILIVGLLNSRKRLLHDFIIGAVVVNSFALHNREI